MRKMKTKNELPFQRSICRLQKQNRTIFKSIQLHVFHFQLFDGLILIIANSQIGKKAFDISLTISIARNRITLHIILETINAPPNEINKFCKFS